MLRVILIALLWASVASAQVQFSPFILTVENSWASAFGAGCTSGVNCLCDQLSIDSDIYWCEDFDHDALTEISPSDGGTYGNGNMVAGGTNRGGSSHWYNKYGSGDGGGNWQNGQPAAPTQGSTCTSSPCSGMRTYTIDDRWTLGTLKPYISFLKAGWLLGPVPSASAEPTIDGSGGNTVFGEAAGAFFVQPGAVGPNSGEKNWPSGAHSQMGYTAAHAYADNILTMSPSPIKIADNVAWKHPEYGGAGGGSWGTASGYQEALTGMHLVDDDWFPYALIPGVSILNCATRKAGASITKGVIRCEFEDTPGVSRVTMKIRPDEADWTFSGSGSPANSWDLSKWHCKMVHYDWTTITATRIRAWHDGVLLIDITLDMSQERFDSPSGTDGVTGFFFDHYANLNGDSNPDTTETTAHFIDNEVHRDGTPVQCSDIGFPSSYDVTF